MNNKIFNSGPIALTTTLTTNLLNPPTASGGVNAGSSAQYIIIKHVRIINKTAAAVTASLYKGASGGNTAGTEWLGIGVSIPPNSFIDYYPITRLESTQYIVGGASSNTSLTIEFEGEIGVAG